MKDDICYLIKFGSEKHMLELFEKGNLYFNTIEYFKNLEEKGNRADKLESSISNKVFKKEDNSTLTLRFKNEKEFKHKIINARITQYKEFLGNIFCLYSIKFNDILNNDYKIDSKIIDDKEYNYCVLITNVSEFLSRIINELNKKDIKFSWKLIEYYNGNENKENLTIFHKPKEYNFQKEFRIALYRSEKKEFILNIGSLKDIAIFDKTKTIKDIEIEYIKDVN